MYILLWVVLGGVTGLLTGRILNSNQNGHWVDIAMGIAGATGTGFLIQYGHFPGRFEIISTVLSAILGAVALTVITSFVNGRRRYA